MSYDELSVQVKFSSENRLISSSYTAIASLSPITGLDDTVSNPYNAERYPTLDRFGRLRKVEKFRGLWHVRHATGAFVSHPSVHFTQILLPLLQLLQRHPVWDLTSASSRITPKEEPLPLLVPTAKLLHLWGDVLSPHEIAEKVKRFFWFYSINRRKSKYPCPKLLGK